MSFARKVPVPIPDRMSANPSSPYFHADHPAVRVTVDGVEYTGRVVEFCRSKGWARILQLDAAGKPIKTHAQGVSLAKWKHGTVQVWLATDPPPPHALTPMVAQ